MPKRKQRKVKAPPKEQLTLSKDEDNNKGSKEERMQALQLFVDDFDIQALSVSKQLVRQFERALTTRAIGRFDALVKQIPKDILDMPYEELLKLGRETSATAVDEAEGSTLSSRQEAMKQMKRKEFVAELNAQMEVQSTSLSPTVLVTPANAPMPAAVPLTISTQGRNPRQGEAITLTAMSARGSPISLCAFKDALSLRQDLTPYITATSRRAL